MSLPTLPIILMLLTLFQTALSHTLGEASKKPISFSTRVYNRRRHMSRSNSSTFTPSKVHSNVHPIPHYRLVMAMLMTELLVDTGSGLTWVQSLPCHSCYNQGDFPYYDRAASKTFDPIYCQDETCKTIPYKTTPLCGATAMSSWILSGEPCSYYVKYLDEYNVHQQVSLVQRLFTFKIHRRRRRRLCWSWYPLV